MVNTYKDDGMVTPHAVHMCVCVCVCVWGGGGGQCSWYSKSWLDNLGHEPQVGLKFSVPRLTQPPVQWVLGLFPMG